MTRKQWVFCTVAVLAFMMVAATVMAFQAPPGFPGGQAPGAVGQRGGGQGQRGAPTAAAPAQTAGGSSQANGPLSILLGPTDPAPKVDRGNPKAPSTDTYYEELPPWEWPPDEFISNPDREFDWHNLKGWHYGPMIEKVTIIGPARVRPGQTVQYEAILKDVTGTANRMNIQYIGPQGRRTMLSANFAPTTPGSNVFRGQLRIPPDAEPGVYRNTYATPDNETSHGKVTHSDHHAGLTHLEVEVLPEPGGGTMDVIPPTIHWMKVNDMDAPQGQIRTQRVQDPIPVFAKVTDNKSGVRNVSVRFTTPQGRFIDANLNRIVGENDVYGAWLSVPEWWEGGQYTLLGATASDRAGKTAYIYQTTSAALKGAVVNMMQDPARIDRKPPRVLSVWLDKDRARLTEAVIVSAVVVDDMSGAGTVAINFAPVPSYIDQVRVHLKPVEKPATVQKSGMDISQNIWTGTLMTAKWQEEGEWQLTRIMARDNADNYLDMLPEYVPEIADVKITFTGGINLFQDLMNYRKGVSPGSIGGGGGGAPMAAAPTPAAATPGTGTPAGAVGSSNLAATGGMPNASNSQSATGKIRRIDMTPPHPPRGACLNCHEP